MITAIIGWLAIFATTIWLSALTFAHLVFPFGKPNKKVTGVLAILALGGWWSIYCLAPFMMTLGANQ